MWPFRRKGKEETINVPGEPGEKEIVMVEDPNKATPPQDAPPGGDPPPADPPRTIEVPVDFFANLGQTLQSIDRKLDFVGQQNTPPPPPPKPEIPDVPDDDYYAAVGEAQQSGDYTQVKKMEAIRRAATEERAVRRMQDQFGPQLDQGAQVIDQLSSRVLRSEMPYYDDLKDEIDAELNKVPVERRMDPNLRLAAYHYAVGKNAGKIIDIENERRLRQQHDGPKPGVPGTGGGARQAAGAGGPGGGGEEVPDYTAVLKPESVAALRGVGKTGDDYARSLGYKDWADYYTNSFKPFYEGTADEGGA